MRHEVAAQALRRGYLRQNLATPLTPLCREENSKHKPNPYSPSRLDSLSLSNLSCELRRTRDEVVAAAARLAAGVRERRASGDSITRIGKRIEVLEARGGGGPVAGVATLD